MDKPLLAPRWKVTVHSPLEGALYAKKQHNPRALKALCDTMDSLAQKHDPRYPKNSKLRVKALQWDTDSRWYGVCETNSFEMSLEAAEQRRVDLVICTLPDEQSERLSLLTELRHRYPSLPLLALATNPMSDNVQAQIEQLTPYYLTKPFAVASLLSMIAHATGIRKTRISLSAISA